jgi:hypothetical protein
MALVVMSMVLLDWVLAGHAAVFIGLARIKHHQSCLIASFR